MAKGPRIQRVRGYDSFWPFYLEGLRVSFYDSEEYIILLKPPHTPDLQP